MTLLKIKDNFAKSQFGFDTWEEFLNHYAGRHPEWFEQYYDEITKIYAMECLKKASENAVIKHIGANYREPWCVNKESIVNENNLI